MCLGRCGSADPVLLPGGVRVLRPRVYGRVHPRHTPRYATGLRPRVAERRAFRGSLVQAEGAVRACPAGPGVPRGLRPRLRLGGMWGGRALRTDVRLERVVRHVSARLGPVQGIGVSGRGILPVHAPGGVRISLVGAGYCLTL